MTDFKYGSSNYNKKLSTADRTSAATVANNVMSTTPAHTPSLADETSRRPHPRLKKSFSECEYYDNGNSGGGLEVSFNLSPSSRHFKETAGDLHHQRLKQTSINDIAFIDGGGNSATKLQYNYDTLKSQYLLQQQQKLKEYKNDPNYLTNGDNYSSESSTETRGILKNCGKNSSVAPPPQPPPTDSNKNSLKRNKGLSTLSLCSCDAETEVTIHSIRLLLYHFSPVYLPECLQRAPLIGRVEARVGGGSRLVERGSSRSGWMDGSDRENIKNKTID